ncbi:MAG TPA: SGNH/GDSL hydrolase family protein [Candidatus Saccharimonadales bacterium]|jgi:lysophospholipase L1-like esterase|nr:SGNH/GDSL hydrolase family protein [Candidatus Saccharimonadales bacterium]
MIPLLVVTLLVGFAAFELAWIKFNGSPVPVPTVSRAPQTIGSGPKRTYVVMGDSTSISQGGDYAQGYATATAQYIAKTHTVTWVNFGVSGARAKDVADLQLKQAVAYKPDIVLVAVGANDVTHLTSIGSVRDSLKKIISGLQAANPNVRIVLTGSPDMGAPPRLPQPLRALAGIRTQSVNNMITGLTDGKRVVFAPTAEKTGPVFRANHHLYAADNFHPTTEGYKVWTPVLTGALDQVL